MRFHLDVSRTILANRGTNSKRFAFFLLDSLGERAYFPNQFRSVF